MAPGTGKKVMDIHNKFIVPCARDGVRSIPISISGLIFLARLGIDPIIAHALICFAFPDFPRSGKTVKKWMNTISEPKDS